MKRIKVLATLVLAGMLFGLVYWIEASARALPERQPSAAAVTEPPAVPGAEPAGVPGAEPGHEGHAHGPGDGHNH